MKARIKSLIILLVLVAGSLGITAVSLQKKPAPPSPPGFFSSLWAAENQLDSPLEKEKEEIAKKQAMIDHQRNITYTVFTLLIISMLVSFIFYFLLRQAQQTRALNVQALKQVEAIQAFSEHLVAQTAEQDFALKAGENSCPEEPAKEA